MEKKWMGWRLSRDVKDVLSSAPHVGFPSDRDEILYMATGGGLPLFEVGYDVPGKGYVVEAAVAKCRNGIVVNYPDPYLRRRDPDCLVIGDDMDTDKPRFREEFGGDFGPVRVETFDWLRSRNLVVVVINIGGRDTGLYGMVIAPDNSGFFVGGIADLQGMVPWDKVPDDFKPEAIIYLAPPFRHTHFEEKQIVVHNRTDEVHEIFSYNLYPGPSAKKGVYGVLLQIGENEKWLTLHGSTVQVVTPYDNITTLLHEGASGSGKSEMLEYPHREHDGRLLLGTNKTTSDRFYIGLNQSCELRPVTDDMAMSLNHYASSDKKLMVYDAEDAWFIRINHIRRYGTDPYLEGICVQPPEPMIFLNIEGTPHSSALIWEHTEDSPGKPCPNPRVILPRRFLNDVVNNPVEVDFRSFGIRAPLCTQQNPSYGIFGLMHILPPALAWLWRLVAPRGESTPSITGAAGLTSEGVGSFWPFATGKFVNHANLLLDQIVRTSQTRYILLPNQHVGSWAVSFMPQWIAREFLARRGMAKFKEDQMVAARCPLLGYLPASMRIEGTLVPEYFFHVEKQNQVGVAAYDEGSRMLTAFFQEELEQYLMPELNKLGRDIITCCLERGTLEDYERLLPMTY